jgi:hypothetical protein
VEKRNSSVADLLISSIFSLRGVGVVVREVRPQAGGGSDTTVT